MREESVRTPEPLEVEERTGSKGKEEWGLAAGGWGSRPDAPLFLPLVVAPRLPHPFTMCKNWTYGSALRVRL